MEGGGKGVASFLTLRDWECLYGMNFSNWSILPHRVFFSYVFSREFKYTGKVRVNES